MICLNTGFQPRQKGHRLLWYFTPKESKKKMLSKVGKGSLWWNLNPTWKFYFLSVKNWFEQNVATNPINNKCYSRKGLIVTKCFQSQRLFPLFGITTLSFFCPPYIDIIREQEIFIHFSKIVFLVIKSSELAFTDRQLIYDIK